MWAASSLVRTRPGDDAQPLLVEEPVPSPAPASESAPTGRWPRWRRRLTRPVLAAAAGLLTCLAFPPWGIWPLAVVGVAAFTLVVRGRRLRAAYGLGICYGLGLLLPLLSWSKVAGIDGWLILTASQALLVALTGPMTALAVRLPAAPLWVATSWVVEEAVRDRVPFGGFPWGRLAFSQGDSPFTGLAAVGGAPLVSFAVALAAGLLAAVLAAVVAAVGHRRPRVRGRPPRARLVPAGLLAACVGVMLVGLAVPTPTSAEHGSAVVAAVQGNVPRSGLDWYGQKRAVTRNHVAETLRLAAQVRAGQRPAPDIVLWPENSSDLDPFNDDDAALLLSQASAAIGRPILVGAVLDGPGQGHVRNTGLLWGPAGYQDQMYVKRHPVPFAEYVPARSVLQRLIGRFASEEPNDFVAGHRAGLLTIPGPRANYRIGDVICFEVAYDGIVRDVAGSQLLVVQTNNATFGHSGETYQQLAMSQLRAVEHGRAVVVVATSGRSAVIAPDGAVLARTGLYTPETLDIRVPLRSSRTLADRMGGWPEALLVGVGAAALAAAVLRGRVGSRRKESR